MQCALILINVSFIVFRASGLAVWIYVDDIIILSPQELITYGQVYANDLAAREEQFVANDIPPSFASKAYFER